MAYGELRGTNAPGPQRSNAWDPVAASPHVTCAFTLQGVGTQVSKTVGQSLGAGIA